MKRRTRMRARPDARRKRARSPPGGDLEKGSSRGKAKHERDDGAGAQFKKPGWMGDVLGNAGVGIGSEAEEARVVRAADGVTRDLFHLRPHRLDVIGGRNDGKQNRERAGEQEQDKVRTVGVRGAPGGPPDQAGGDEQQQPDQVEQQLHELRGSSFAAPGCEGSRGGKTAGSAFPLLYFLVPEDAKRISMVPKDLYKQAEKFLRSGVRGRGRRSTSARAASERGRCGPSPGLRPPHRHGRRRFREGGCRRKESPGHRRRS